MDIIVAGQGKLARSILSGLKREYAVCDWDHFDKKKSGKNIVIHAGSGRQRPECEEYCRESGSFLLELSTGHEADLLQKKFPLIICPNTAIPVLKLMNLLSLYGKIFQDYQISITESHQSSKTTVAGTASELARFFGQGPECIKAVRDIQIQKKDIGIPDEFLPLHAYHKITIEDAGCQINLETRVLGHEAYVAGLKKIIDCLGKREWESRTYQIIELVQNGWLYGV
jgi:hypothetical protein